MTCRGPGSSLPPGTHTTSTSGASAPLSVAKGPPREEDSEPWGAEEGGHGCVAACTWTPGCWWVAGGGFRPVAEMAVPVCSGDWRVSPLSYGRRSTRGCHDTHGRQASPATRVHCALLVHYPHGQRRAAACRLPPSRRRRRRRLRVPSTAPRSTPRRHRPQRRTVGAPSSTTRGRSPSTGAWSTFYVRPSPARPPRCCPLPNSTGRSDSGLSWTTFGCNCIDYTPIPFLRPSPSSYCWNPRPTALTKALSPEHAPCPRRSPASPRQLQVRPPAAPRRRPRAAGPAPCTARDAAGRPPTPPWPPTPAAPARQWWRQAPRHRGQRPAGVVIESVSGAVEVVRG